MTMPRPLRVYVGGIGFAIDGMASWDSARPILAGSAPYVPGPFGHASPDILPAAERRRAGPVIRLAMAVAQEAISAAAVDAGELGSVFASSDGDGENVHQICLALANAKPEISPTRFHNSVQNAASGYWSIATRSHAPSNTVNGFDVVFATGLLEAVVQATVEARTMLLVAYDLPMVEPLYTLRPLTASCGVALVLSPQPLPQTIAQIELGITSGDGVQQSTLDDAALERLRAGNPAARALPLLQAFARRAAGTITFALDGAQSLSIGVSYPG